MQTVSDQNVAKQVTEELRDAIYAGELKPGERLVERKLAARLGVSHIPVREALARLAEERLVEREPRRGARVARMTRADLDEITSLRIVLEQFVAERAQERWNDDARNRLETILDAMDAAEPGDTAEIFRQDRAFHETLSELAEHRLLSDMSTRLQGRIASFLLATTSELSADQQHAHTQSHRVIVDALASGDATHLREVIAHHIVEGAARIPLDDPDRE
ncbi:GntR family transcriptional regulator [Microbacterium gorillae]|uniref:GntR family transcriptional regulator n=1 Tax=Microbacterium gorillae TaxID=1231063 RepID=UPI003D988DCC